MGNMRHYISQFLIFSFILLLAFTSSSFKLYAEENEWLEVSKVDNELISINPSSIKYNNKGFLSVIARYSEIDLSDQSVINSDPFLMAIDCDNRLFSKFPVNTELKQVKNWETPVNNKLIKKTIINSCSY